MLEKIIFGLKKGGEKKSSSKMLKKQIFVKIMYKVKEKIKFTKND